MTPKKLKEYGSLIFGEKQWRAGLAKALGVSIYKVNNVYHGKKYYYLPEATPAQIKSILIKQRAKIDSAIKELS